MKKSAVPELVARSLHESVAAHLLADVPVGLFLSSGIDSGALLGLMRDAGQSRVRAITLGFREFHDTSEDEAPLAAEIARRHSAHHVIRTVERAEFENDLPLILEAMDQPSIDGVNTWFVAKAAKEAGLKVALSGLGGDELLAGYPSFSDVPTWVRRLRGPGVIPGLGGAARRLGTLLGLAGETPKRLGILEFGGTWEGAYFLRRAVYLPFELETQLDRKLLYSGLRRLNLLQRVKTNGLNPAPPSPIARVSSLESTCYLRNQLLRDSDWAGMAHSLEIRTPYVDFTLLNQLAPAMKFLGSGWGKRLVSQAPSSPLSEREINRPKTGFGVPTARWMELTACGGGAPTKGGASRAWAGFLGKRLIPALAGQPQ